MQEENTPAPAKLFSARAIQITTFLCGPLAAGLLLRANFNNLGREKLAQRSLFFSILFTCLMFGLLFTIPQEYIDKGPNYLLPALYTLLTLLVVNKYQGKALRLHSENGHPFYSGWKAAGTGLLSLGVTLVAIFSYVLTLPGEDIADYDNGFIAFQQNEEQAMEMYTLLSAADFEGAVKHIHQKGIPAWEENLEILNRMEELEELNRDEKVNTAELRRYCNLRIECYQLMAKALSEDSDRYDERIEQLNVEIKHLLLNL